MARSLFGGVMAAWVVSRADTTDSTGAGVQVVTLPDTGTTLTIYDAPSGNVVADFLDASGVAITEIATTAGDPYIPQFSGPDGVESLWVQSESGRWLPIPRWDDGTGAGGGGTGDVQLAGGNSFEYPDSQAPPWLLLRRPNDNSDSTTWANMVAVQYWDNSTSQYRDGFYVNEKALLRTRGTTPSDTVARFMAHPDQSAGVAVMETTKNDNAVKLLQSFEDKTVSHVPVTVPYFVNEQGEKLFFGTQDPATGPYASQLQPGDAWIDYNGAA